VPPSGIWQVVIFFEKKLKKAAISPNPLWQALYLGNSMKQGVWAETSKLMLSEHGFTENKPHVFRKVNNGILFHIEFLGKKQDIYIWYSMLPISMPNIWTSVGYGKAAGRVPSDEKTLSIKTDGDIALVQTELQSLLSNEVIPLFESIDSVEALTKLLKSDEAILVNYPLGFSLVQAGKFKEAFTSFEKITNIEYLSLKEEKDIIQKLASLTDEQMLEQLDKYKQKNISKLGLASANSKK
jgi:hypothetical protein